MSDDQGIGPVTDAERKQIADHAAFDEMSDNTIRDLLSGTDAEHVTAIIAREAGTGDDLGLTDLAWMYAHTSVRLVGLAAELEEAHEAFNVVEAKRLEHEQTIVDDRERIARAIEVARGDRCPTCQGRAANWETAARCGGGHRWTRPSRDALAHVDFAAIARTGGAA